MGAQADLGTVYVLPGSIKKHSYSTRYVVEIWQLKDILA